MSPRLRRALPWLVALAAILPFLPALHGELLSWDDKANLLEDGSWSGLTRTHLRWMFMTVRMGPYMPLTWLTYGLDHALWGMNPTGYHATNLLLHGANAALLYGLARSLLLRAAPKTTEREAAAAAVFAALLWAVHPLRVESVAWISERRDCLSGLFALLVLRLHLEKPGRVLTLGVFLLGLLSKGSLVAMPLILFALDLWPLRRPAREAALEKIPMLVLSIGFGLLGLYGQHWAGALRDFEQSGWEQRAALSVYGLGWYLARSVWPSGLTPFHQVPKDFGLTTPATLGFGALFVAACAAAWAVRRRVPAVPAALVFYALALSPLLGAVRFGGHLVAERYSYLALLGPVVLAAGAWLGARRLRPRAAEAGAAALLLALAAATARYAADWRGDLPLWTRAVAVEPDSVTARINLIAALRKDGRMDEAAEHEAVASRLKPRLAEPLNNLAAWKIARGEFAEAEELARRAVARMPELTPPHYTLGRALLGLKRPVEAAAELSHALQHMPGDAAVRNDLGLALLAAGNAAGAEVQLRLAGRVRGDWAPPVYNLGKALTARGRHAEAAEAYAEAARRDPTMLEAWVNGGNASARAGRYAEAARRWRKALEIAPADPDARAGLRQVKRIGF